MPGMIRYQALGIPMIFPGSRRWRGCWALSHPLDAWNGQIPILRVLGITEALEDMFLFFSFCCWGWGWGEGESVSCAKSDTVVLPGEIDDKGVCKYISMCIYVYDYKICIYIHYIQHIYIYWDSCPSQVCYPESLWGCEGCVFPPNRGNPILDQGFEGGGFPNMP